MPWKNKKISFSRLSIPGDIALTVIVLLIVVINLPQKVNAATLTWDGGGADNNWSTCANWTTDTCPVAGDTVTFNATSTKNSTVNAGFGGTITTININAGYTGTITLARSLTVNTSFVQAAGTFTAGAQTLDMNGSFTLSAGTFTASSGSTTLAGAMTISGSPTFNHNSGTFTFDGSTTATLSCNNVTFDLVTFAHTGNITKTVSSNCTLPLGNNPTVGADSNADLTLNGTLSGTGTLTNGTASTGNLLTLNSTSSLSGFSGLAAGILTVSGATANFGSYTTFTVASTYTQTGGTITVPSGADFNSVFTLSSSGVFNAPSGVMTVASNFTLNSGTTFNANGGTVTFDGGSGTLACNNTVFNLVTFNKSSTKTVGSDCSLPLGANPNLAGTGSLVLNGTLSGSGTLTSTGWLFLNSTAVLAGFNGFIMNSGLTITGATINFGGYTAFSVAGSYGQTGGTVTVPGGADFNGIFILSSGGVFNAPAGAMTVASNFTLNSGTTFNANGGTVTFDGGSGTLACNNTVFNLVSFNHTAVKTVNSDCDLPLGNSPVVGNGGYIILNGRLSGSGTLTAIGSFTLNSGHVLSGFSGFSVTNLTVDGSTANFGSYNTLDINGNLVLQNNAAFIANLANTTIGGNITNNAGSAFNPNSGTVILDGNDQTITGTVTFNNLNKAVGTAATLTFPADATTTILGTLTLKGADGQLLNLVSSTPGTQWQIDPQGAGRDVSYVAVTDSQNVNAAPIVACDSADNGNNISWSFNPASCDPVVPPGGGSGGGGSSGSNLGSSGGSIRGITTNNGLSNEAVTVEQTPPPPTPLNDQDQDREQDNPESPLPITTSNGGKAWLFRVLGGFVLGGLLILAWKKRRRHDEPPMNGPTVLPNQPLPPAGPTSGLPAARSTTFYPQNNTKKVNWQ